MNYQSDFDLARAEREINEARLSRERQVRAEDRAQREKLERASPSSGRVNLVDVLNGHSRAAAEVEGEGVDVISKLRASQKLNYRSAEAHNRAYQRFEKSEAFNRLTDSPGSNHEAPSGYNFRPNDPGQREPSQFGHSERYDPPRRVGGVADSGGRLRSNDPRARDHWDDQGVHRIDPSFLLEITRQILEYVNSAAYARHKV